VLVEDGVLDDGNIRQLGLRRMEVETAVRRQGATSMDDVKLATLSPGGAIVVDLEPDAMAATCADVKRIEEKLDRLLAASNA
jgi:uncharacterized membrane protein YcaP (DUF421 family)